MTDRILCLTALCVLSLGAAASAQDMAEMYAQGFKLDAELKARSAPIMPSLRWQRNVIFAEALPVKEGKSTTSLALDLLHPAEDTAEPRPLVLFVHGGGWASGNRSMGEGFLPLFAGGGDFVVPSFSRCSLPCSAPRCGRRSVLDSNQRGVTRGGSRSNCHLGPFSRGSLGHPHGCFRS